MTRVLEVVNLSNWEAEDFRVYYEDYQGKEQSVVLVPGESFTIPDNHEAGSIRWEPEEPMEPRVSRLEGRDSRG